MKLKKVQRLDSFRLDETYFTEEGYLLDDVICTRVGVFIYTNPDGSERRELRLPEHVFEQESLDSYLGKPVILTHNAGRVDKDNVEDEHIGTILTKGYRDGENVKVKIVIHDVEALKESGLRELSLGYDVVLIEEPGEYKGQRYDAIQTEIRINHLALVDDARAGGQARLNIDSKDKHEEGGNTMARNTRKTPAKKISAFLKRASRRDSDEEMQEETAGLPDELAEGGETSVEERIQEVLDRRDRRRDSDEPETAEDAMAIIAEQEEDIEKLCDIIEELQADEPANEDEDEEDVPEDNSEDDDAPAPFTMSDDELESEDEDDEPNEDCDELTEDDDIPVLGSEEDEGGFTLTIRADSVDKIVAERIKLGRIGDKLRLDGLENMNQWDAKKKIIRKVLPGMRLDGKSKAYVTAAFDLAMSQIDNVVRKDAAYQRKQMTARADSANVREIPESQKARERMINRMNERKTGGK